MWTVPVVVPGVLGQDLAEMPFAKGQHVIQALTAQCSHDPVRPQAPGSTRAKAAITVGVRSPARSRTGRIVSSQTADDAVNQQVSYLCTFLEPHTPSTRLIVTTSPSK
jgi:hypothetical protein